MEGNDNSNLVGVFKPGVKENFDFSETVTLPRLEDIRESTTSKTYQYLHKLIKGKSIANLNEIISPSTPLPLFEESLRLMIIDHLHLKDEVVKILLSQNDYQIKRILNCKWFFQSLPSEFCTTELFPFVSYSLRCKIINRLSKHLSDTEEAEMYFEFVRANYDNERADYLLPRCSPQFILQHFQKNGITFKQNAHDAILFNICKRHPVVGLQILSSIFEDKKKYSPIVGRYNAILSYLAGYHPDLVVPFIINHRTVIPSEIFGKKLTRKLAAKLRDRLIPDYVEKLLFKEDHLFRLLSFEEKVKFVVAAVRNEMAELSFQSWRNADYRICHLLKFVPQYRRPEFIESAFREVYNSGYSENSVIWSSGILELLPTEIRQPYVARLEEFLKASRTEFFDNLNTMSFNPDIPDGIIYLYDSTTAFQKLKELLRKTPSASRRESILNHMVKTCSINSDVKTLGEAVEFVATRHRNDDPRVVYGFAEAICENFSATDLNSEIFEKLQDLVNFFVLKGHRNDHVYSTWKERHIYYRLENGLDVDAHVNNFFESVVVGRYCHGAFLQDLRSKHSRKLVVDLCEKAANVILKESTGVLSENSKNLLSGVLMTWSEFNKLPRGGRIVLGNVRGLAEILSRQLVSNFCDAGGDSWPLKIWERYYNNVLNSYFRPKYLLYALKRRQDLIEKHVEGILNILLSDFIRTYNAFLNYFTMSLSFFGKTDEFKAMVLNSFQNGDSIHKRRTALELYSRVCTVEEFSEAIEEYIPQQEKMEVGSDEEHDEIQISIPGLIKHVRPRWKSLQLTLKFFFGDFLKSVLTSFLACCNHTRYDAVIPFLKRQLKDVPQKVSYKKEIIRLILQLSDRKDRSNFCSGGWKDHDHYSLRGILLREIFKLFLEQPSRESFGRLEKCILECDEMTIEVRPLLREMPKDYWNDYVALLWRFSEDKAPDFKNAFRKEILCNFNGSNIGLLSGSLSELIIKNNLFAPSSELRVERFAAFYLAADPQAVEARVRMVLTLMKSRKTDAQSVCNFLTTLMDMSWEDPVYFADAFTIILDNWPQYRFGVLHRQRIRFEYHGVHQKVVKRTPDPARVPEEFGKELRNLFARVDELRDLIPIYSEPLVLFFKEFKAGNAVRALREMATGCTDRALAVLIVTSVPEEAVSWLDTKNEVFTEERVENKKILTDIVQILEGFGDDVVNVYLRAKFEFLKSEFPVPDASVSAGGDAGV